MMPPNTAAQDRESIKERITTLESADKAIYKQLGVMDERSMLTAKSVEEVRRSIYGYDGTVGLIHRIYTNEEKLADIKKLVWAVLVVLLGLISTTIYNIIIERASVLVTK
jgi:hypothetical protein